MEGRGQVDPPPEEVFWQDWGDWSEDRRAKVGREWAEVVESMTSMRGFTDESASLAKRFNPHHTTFNPQRRGPRHWFNLQVIPAPQKGEDSTRWWITIEDTEDPFAFSGGWPESVKGLPGLPMQFCAHHLLEADPVYSRAVYVTYRVEVAWDLTFGSHITFWTDPDLSTGITQEHMRSAPSLPVVLERVVPALVKHSDTWDDTDAEARKVARRLLPGHSQRRGPARFELQRIADTYNSAGDQPMRAVQDRYGLTPSTARNRIREARRQGLVTRPAPKGGRPRKTGDKPR